MREDVLHYVWKTRKFRSSELETSSNKSIEVIEVGQHNTSSGPDFFNARVRIDGQEWAGNLEIHIKSSDWYVHGHEKDINYNNVILHVVWEDNIDVFRNDGSKIPALSLKNYVDPALLESCKNLLERQNVKFINCEKHVATIDNIVWKQWQQRLFVERLEKKSQVINELLVKTKNDWENVLFLLLLKNFGLNKNGEAFMALGQHIEGKIWKKVLKNVVNAESLLFGLAGFLSQHELFDEYHQNLRKEYEYLRNKFQIQEYIGQKPIFFGLRPSNFPTIRLSQLANLYHVHPNLFGVLIEAKTTEEFGKLFNISASSYWDNHYTFGKESKPRKKTLTKSFIQLILINTIVPLKFCYSKHLGNSDAESLFGLLNNIPPEKNSIVSRYESVGIPSESAFDSQTKIQLYHDYCSQNRCLECQVGHTLLGRKN